MKTVPGFHPSGALRAPKFVPDEFFNRKSSKDNQYSCAFAQSEQPNLTASWAQIVQSYYFSLP
jgi:hypothetical protein